MANRDDDLAAQKLPTSTPSWANSKRFKHW